MAQLPNPQITPIPNNEPDATPALWNTRYIEIDANFSDLNTRTNAVELELENSRGNYATLPAAISTIDDRVANLEVSIAGADTFSIAMIKKASRLDWSYRNDRIAFEFFTENYTLVDKEPVAVLSGILGDDSLDIQDTAGIVEGNYYVLSNGTNTVMIRVKNVLSTQRLRLYSALDYHFGTGAKISMHNFDVQPQTGFALAKDGAMWMSKLINIGNRDGKAVLRRTNNAALVKVYYQGQDESIWHETTPVPRITNEIDGVPAGFVDVEYPLPVFESHNFRLMIQVLGADVEIHHIAAFGLQYLESLNLAIEQVAQNHVELEHKADIHHYASTLDWAYRFDRMNFEFFDPNYTLINRETVAIAKSVAQDDSLCVVDNSQFQVGDYYVLHDAVDTRLIQIKQVLTENVITIEGHLDRSWGVGAFVSKCNFNVLGSNNAVANHGQMWISKPIVLSTDELDGFAVIRRTHNTAQVKLWWLTEQSSAWTESPAELRQIGSTDNKDGVPVGFADYAYRLPFTGEGKIRIEIIDEPQPVNGVLTPNSRPVTIMHITAVGLFNALIAVNGEIDALNASLNHTKTDVITLDSRQGEVENIVDKHHYASRLDWAYRYDRMNYEFFTPDYTLLHKPITTLRHPAVIGDNTLEVDDSSTFEAGDYYVLSDSTHNTITAPENTLLIKVAQVHSDNVVTIEGTFSRRWDVNSTIRKCNLNILGVNNAVGQDGEMWISKPIAISTDALDGFVMIRRTHNDAQIKLFWIDDNHSTWQEATSELRRVGSAENIDGVPVGFADYKFITPMSGVGKIRIEIIDPPVVVGGVTHYNTRPVTIKHIVTVGLFALDGEINVNLSNYYSKAQTDALIDAIDTGGSAFTQAEKDKLEAIEAGAQVNPTFKTINGQPITGSGDIVVLGDSATAAELTFSPVGGIAATNVQNAIAELDSEKANAADVYNKTQIDALIDAIDTGGSAFTQAEKDKLEAIEAGAQVNPTFKTINGQPITGSGDIVVLGDSGTGATTAAELTFSPVGGIAATNVQNAIAELDSEKANAADVYNKTQIDALVIGNLTITTIDGGTF